MASHELDISRQRREGGISCLAFTPFAGSGTLNGFGDFHIAPWHFRVFGCTCHRQWVQLPSKAMLDKSGTPLRDEERNKIRYSPVIGFDDKDLLRRFSEAACAALDLYHPGWDS